MSLLRKNILEYVSLLASGSEQLRYERDVPIACVPDELISGYLDDLFHLKNPEFLDAFTEDEIKDLAELYGLLSLASKTFRDKNRSLANLLKNKEFRIAVSFAKELRVRLKGSPK